MQKKQQKVNERIARNAISLYVRMFFTMLVSLYASRVVLKVLGVSDYGLYNVIGGILTMFEMLSAALTVGTQRFLTYALGENDIIKLKNTFSMSLLLHVILAIIIFIISETIGLWFLKHVMNIPDGREIAAFWVYQFTILGFIVALIQVPFQSSLIAHEQMGMYAYMSIYDVTMKLLLIWVLQFYQFDKLILYGGLILLVNVSSVAIYNFYTRKNFLECRFKFFWSKTFAKEMASYCGWNLIGGSLGFFTNQGVNILLNVFCGTTVNAARGISMQINSVVYNFVANFQKAVNPQIVKQYASKEYQSLYKLVINNSRLAEYLYLLIAIPLFIEIEFVLKIWLEDYPDYTPVFVQLILIQTAEMPMNQPVGMIVQASGKMKYPSLWMSIILLVFPLSYILLSNGFSPVYVYAVGIICWFAMNLINIYYANKYSGISVKQIVKGVYFNVLAGGSVMFIVPYCISTQFVPSFERFLIVGIVSVINSLFVIFFLGFTNGMRHAILVKMRIRKQ